MTASWKQTWVLQLPNSPKNSVMDWLNNSFDNVAKINIVGNPCISEYQGIKTLQFVIDDVDVLSTSFEDIEYNGEDEDESW